MKDNDISKDKWILSIEAWLDYLLFTKPPEVVKNVINLKCFIKAEKLNKGHC